MIKLTLIMQVDQATPTETWYFPQFSAADNPDTQAALTLISNARAALLCPPATMLGVRLVSADQPRYGIFLAPGLFHQNGIYAGTKADRDYSSIFWTAGLFGGRIARRYLAGAPDQAIGNEQGNVRGYQGFGSWGDAFNAYRDALIAGGACVRSIIDDSHECVGVVTAAQFPGLIGVQVPTQLTFFAPFFSPPGSAPVRAVHLKGFRSLNTRAAGLHGVYRVAGEVAPVSPASTPWTYYLYKTDNVNPANIEVRGNVSPLAYEALAVQRGAIIGATHHKRGGRVFLPVGRSKTRA